MYVIAADSIKAAQVLASHPDAAAALDELASMVDRLHALEASYAERVQAARVAAGEQVRPLSRAAREEIEASADGTAFVFKMQRRRCKRATSAGEVIEALLPDARGDLESWEWMMRKCDDGPPRDVLAELIGAKRTVIEAMREFVRCFGGQSSSLDPAGQGGGD